MFDFISDLEKKTNLEFNKISYSFDEKVEEEYAFIQTKKISKNDIIVYSDNYVLVGHENNKIFNLNDIKKENIGVLSSDIEDAVKYLNLSDGMYKAYESTEKLMSEFTTDGTELQYILVPKLVLLANLKNEDGLYINYQVTEIEDNYVIRLGKDKNLNSILTKYYDSYAKASFEEKYAKYFTNLYFDLYEIDQASVTSFRSKRYTYGFIDHSPFDTELTGRLTGINYEIIKNFVEHTNVEIIYQNYSTQKRLIDALNKGKVDFFFNMYDKNKYSGEIIETINPLQKDPVIVTNIENHVNINSIASLQNYEVKTLENSQIEASLKKANVKVKSYKNLNALINASNETSLTALDHEVYYLYKNSTFKNSKATHLNDIDTNYNYVIRTTKENKVFANFFNFYLTYANETALADKGLHEVYRNIGRQAIYKTVLYSGIAALGLIIVLVIPKLFKKKEKKKVIKSNLRKEDKLKYIDILTSLKNRNYLNDNIALWDASETYPQAIVIVDLNNIAYINDNYGHEEGDTVIKQAANILITNQESKTDIIRTNGNEFLIYMVSYSEKEVIAYLKKLNKEFKELSHGFGAASGYSMITDGIKTIDDAINEATLDMRNNKQK